MSREFVMAEFILRRLATKEKSLYASSLAGKRVCLVGPSPILVGRSLGNKIDSYDFIAKTSGAAYIYRTLEDGKTQIDDEDYLRDYGRRIDIWYVNSQFGRVLAPPRFRLRKNKIKFVRMKRFSKAWQAMQHEYDMRRTLLEVSGITQAHHSLLTNYGLRRPTLGLIALEDIFLCGAKEIYIVGFDFYSSRIYPQGEFWATKRDFSAEYYGDYGRVPEFVKKVGDAKLNGHSWDTHEHYKGALYVKKFYENSNGILKMDDFTLDALRRAIKKFKGFK